MTTTITPEEINVFQKAYLQLWDIDEGDLSIYRYSMIDGQVFPLSEMDTPEEIARELAQVWETAWPRISGLINALRSAESDAAKWEHDYYVLHLEMDGCLARLESANHTISTLRRDLELAKKGAEMAEGLRRERDWLAERISTICDPASLGCPLDIPCPHKRKCANVTAQDWRKVAQEAAKDGA